MPDPTICPSCKSPVPADAPGGTCPTCLLAAAFPTGGSAPPLEAPSAAEVAQKLPAFEILGLLGRGGMGVVWRARQKGLDRIVALKVLPMAAAMSPGFAERFQREARALARLSHPNIVAVHEFGETNGLFYLAMEYVDGVNVREALREGHLGAREALRIVPQICDALQYAHDHGVVHRDIKPENVLIGLDGQVKVADFGLAKIMAGEGSVRDLTVTGQRMGTPHYMAPEQVERPGSVDHRADIFSLGVVFYEMLTGELPLGRFPPPSVKFHLDVRLDEVVLRSLEKEPERRWQQASQVKSEVGVIAEGPAPETTSAPPTHSLVAETGESPSTRREFLASALLAAFGTMVWFEADGRFEWSLLPLAGLALMALAVWHRRRRCDASDIERSRWRFAGAALIVLAIAGFAMVPNGDRIGAIPAVAQAMGTLCLLFAASGSKRARQDRPSRWRVAVTFVLALLGLFSMYVGVAAFVFMWQSPTTRTEVMEVPVDSIHRVVPAAESPAGNPASVPYVGGATAARWPATEFEAVSDNGDFVSVSAEDRRAIADLWNHVVHLSTKPNFEEALGLYYLTDSDTIRSMPEAERKSKGDAGLLGLPLLDPAKARGPLSKFRLVTVRFEGAAAFIGSYYGATATVTDGRTTLRFRLERKLLNTRGGIDILTGREVPGPLVAGWSLAVAPVAIE